MEEEGLHRLCRRLHAQCDRLGADWGNQRPGTDIRKPLMTDEGMLAHHGSPYAQAYAQTKSNARGDSDRGTARDSHAQSTHSSTTSLQDALVALEGVLERLLSLDPPKSPVSPHCSLLSLDSPIPPRMPGTMGISRTSCSMNHELCRTLEAYGLYEKNDVTYVCERARSADLIRAKLARMNSERKMQEVKILALKKQLVLSLVTFC